MQTLTFLLNTYLDITRPFVRWCTSPIAFAAFLLGEDSKPYILSILIIFFLCSSKIH